MYQVKRDSFGRVSANEQRVVNDKRRVGEAAVLVATDCDPFDAGLSHFHLASQVIQCQWANQRVVE